MAANWASVNKTLSRTMANGVRALGKAPKISNVELLIVPDATIVPLVDVIVPVLLVARKAWAPTSGAMSRSANVIAPWLLDKLTPAPDDCAELVLPKLNAAPSGADCTLMPMPFGLVT